MNTLTIAGYGSAIEGFVEVRGVWHSVSSVAKFKVIVYDENDEIVFVGFGDHSIVYLPEMLGSYKTRIINRDAQTTDFYINALNSFALK